MNAREDARAVALAEELGAQVGRLKGAGPKVRQFLSLVQLDPGDRSRPALGAIPGGVQALPFGKVQKVIDCHTCTPTSRRAAYS